MRWTDAARDTAIGCALALACASALQAQEGGATAGATGGGASSPGTGGAAVGTAGAPAGVGSGPAPGTGLSGWGGLGLRLPDLSARGIEPPQFIFGIRSTATLSDNLQRRSSGNERSAFLLEASPYVVARSTAPRASYDLSYQMRNFMRIGDDSDLTLLRHNLNGRGSFALAGDNLWLDVSAFMGSVNTAPDGALSIDPSSTFNNRSNYRRYSVAPWYQDRIGSWAIYRARYELSRSEGSGSSRLARWTHHASASIDGIDRGGKWNWGWHGYYQSRDFGDVTLDRRFSAATLHYRYSHRLRLSASIEYEQIDNVFNDEGDDHGWGPALGFQWNPNSRLSMSGHVADRYYGTVGSGQISWSTRRSTLGVAASKSVMTSSQSALLLDPLALALGPGGAANPLISDLISSGQLSPGGIPMARAWITDNAVFDRRVTAFWALRGASRTLTLSAWASTRESAATFSTPASSGGIRGSGTGESFTFDGELRERGIGLSFSQSLDARTRIEASIDRREVESPTAGFENRLNTLRLGIVGHLTSDLSAFAGIRLTRQDSSGRGTEYDENAIFAGVDKRF